ncbi:MAG: glycosyltransferase [Bacteroidota bacterium]|nr:glycosyltransferase [Bacteroidota bacterium]
MKRAVVAVYVDPDFFPPTINAILNLAGQMDEVVVISRNNSVDDYPYPPNVRLRKIGKQVSVRDMEKQPLLTKISSFLQFSFSLYREAKNKATDLVLLYDPFALFAFFVLRRFWHKKKVWYHNHDLPDLGKLRKYSLGYWAAKYELKAMKHIDFFSLPSRERLAFYPMLKPEIPVFIIPNYPSLQVYKREHKTHFENDRVRIIYQGFIGPGHGLEVITKLLGEKINGYELQLVLKGSVSDDYRSSIDQLAKEYNVTGQVNWIGIGGYRDLPSLTRGCDIGIGINANSDAVSLTQGTSSNKIYEYAASGLPVLVNNNEQFNKYLGSYGWVYFTDGSEIVTRKMLEAIIKNIPSDCKSGRKEFENSLNFEMHFKPALEKVFKGH